MNRKAKDLILEDQLMLSNPESVSKWLETTNASGSELASLLRPYDEEIEMTLLNRGDPLVNLALAQFGTNIEMLKQIWETTEKTPEKYTGHTSALRLAILSNQNAGGTFFLGGSGLISVIGLDVFTSFLELASNEELQALGQNPRLGFFEALYQKTGVFEALTDDRWRQLITATVGNPRLSEKYDDSDDTDGYGEFQHNSVFSAIYALPAKVAVTKEWAATLAWLLDKTLPYLPYKTTLDDVESTMARWRAPLFEKPAEASFHIDPSDYLRTYYGRLYFSYGIKKPVLDVMASDDQATRCAAYAWGELTPEHIKLGAEKDKDEFLKWACSNTNLCKTEALREAVREACSKFGDGEGDESLRFHFVCTEQHKAHPNWFLDDPYKEDMEDHQRRSSPQPEAPPNPDMLTLKNDVGAISKKVETLYGIAIVTCLAVLWQLFFR